METQCNLAIAKYTLFNKKDKLLLACSGGKDSIALFHYLRRAGYKMEVAHVNFNLRKDADSDAAFVKNLCDSYDIPFYLHRVDKNLVPKSNIQEWARNTRYQFFHKVLKAENIPYLVIAHSLDDYIESMFMHIGKGRNFQDDPGIAIRDNRIRRPLMLASTDSIIDFLKKHNFPYRTDPSNLTDAYERNRVRHHLLPHFKNLYPDIYSGVRKFIYNNHLKKSLLNHSYSILYRELITIKGQLTQISVTSTHDRFLLEAFVSKFLTNYGFHPKDIKPILGMKTGKITSSATHEILKDRTTLLLRKLKPKKSPHPISISRPIVTAPESYLTESGRLTINPVNQFQAVKDPQCEYLLLSDNQFPLTLRRWTEGDRMQPLGMRGVKKVKKILTELKVNLWDKASTCVLVDSDEQIIWLIPHRISDLVKVPTEPHAENKKIYRLTWTERKSD